MDISKQNSGTSWTIVHSVLQAVQTAVYRYEGSLNKFLMDDKGSTLIAVFGLPPLAHEDDSVRGILSALAICAKLHELGLTASIGVTTGPAFCGVVGARGRREYSVLGDTVNLAARLMQYAGTKQGGVICDSPTQFSARSRLHFENVGKITVKGKTKPINIWQPYSASLLNLAQTLKTQATTRTSESTSLSAPESPRMLHRNNRDSLIHATGANIGLNSLRSIFDEMNVNLNADQNKQANTDTANKPSMLRATSLPSAPVTLSRQPSNTLTESDSTPSKRKEVPNVINTPKNLMAEIHNFQISSFAKNHFELFKRKRQQQKYYTLQKPLPSEQTDHTAEQNGVVLSDGLVVSPDGKSTSIPAHSASMFFARNATDMQLAIDYGSPDPNKPKAEPTAENTDVSQLPPAALATSTPTSPAAAASRRAAGITSPPSHLSKGNITRFKVAKPNLKRNASTSPVRRAAQQTNGGAVLPSDGSTSPTSPDGTIPQLFRAISSPGRSLGTPVNSTVEPYTLRFAHILFPTHPSINPITIPLRKAKGAEKTNTATDADKTMAETTNESNKTDQSSDDLLIHTVEELREAVWDKVGDKLALTNMCDYSFIPLSAAMDQTCKLRDDIQTEHLHVFAEIVTFPLQPHRPPVKSHTVSLNFVKRTEDKHANQLKVYKEVLLHKIDNACTHKRGGVVVVEAEVGMGKSRLLYEAISESPIATYCGAGNPFEMNRPLSVLRDIFLQILDSEIERAGEQQYRGGVAQNRRSIIQNKLKLKRLVGSDSLDKLASVNINISHNMRSFGNFQSTY